MSHLPHKTQILLRALKNPSELLRIVKIVWASFRYRWLQRCTGPNTVVGEGCVMVNSANIKIGSNCLLQDRVYLRAGIDGSILLHDGAALNSFVQMYGHGGIVVGKDAQVGPNTVITTTGHDYMSTDLDSEYAAITIGERVWIGANCTIIGGVHIGDQAVIGAGAVVTKDIPARCVAVGVRARVIRSFDDSDDSKTANEPD